MTDDLARWLRVQLDEDAALQQNSLEQWHHPDCESLPDGDAYTFSCSCGVPEQVLRAIEADRALIDDYLSAQKTVDAIVHPDMYDVGRAQGLEEAVRRRASAFDQRPGYRDEWRP